jgi:hypothetical protein
MDREGAAPGGDEVGGGAVLEDGEADLLDHGPLWVSKVDESATGSLKSSQLYVRYPAASAMTTMAHTSASQRITRAPVVRSSGPS